MPKFEVSGVGRDTGRNRHRVYDAPDEEAARMMAFRDATMVETIRQVPGEPATEKQKIYARALGLEFDPSISKDDISARIDAQIHSHPDIAGILQSLAADRRTARITYWKNGESESSVRIVEPYDLIQGDNTQQYFRCWQLSPHPDDGDHWRTFRLDRIKSAQDGGGSFSPRPLPNVSEVIAGISSFGQPRKHKSLSPVVWIVLALAILILIATMNMR